MKTLTLAIVATVALFTLPACTEVHEHGGGSTTSSTTESHSVRTPVGGVSQTTSRTSTY